MEHKISPLNMRSAGTSVSTREPIDSEINARSRSHAAGASRLEPDKVEIPSSDWKHSLQKQSVFNERQPRLLYGQKIWWVIL